MKGAMDLPSLTDAGIGKKFRIFIEIARHPDGVTVGEITKAFYSVKKGTKQFKYVKQGISHHVKALQLAAYITTDYEKRNGHPEVICKVTPYGVDTVHGEMCRLCQMLGEITKEMIKVSPES